MLAPEKFAKWMTNHSHTDQYGTWHYHPRSDEHSKALAKMVVSDLLDRCQVLRDQAARGEVAYGVNLRYTWPSTNKAKTLDLAIGVPATPPQMVMGDIAIPKVSLLRHVLLSCEAKAVMTEHVKSKPRVFDELSSSHEIVHSGDQNAIAAGITVVNIADTFISPTRQKIPGQLIVSKHRQPHVAAAMIQQLRGLHIRDSVGQVGFDAYATFVVNADNQGPVHLYTNTPAPQPGDRDFYETFLQRLTQLYTERFSSLPRTP